MNQNEENEKAKKMMGQVTPRMMHAMQSVPPSGNLQASFYTQYDAVQQFHVCAELPIGNMAARTKTEHLEMYLKRVEEEVIREFIPTLTRIIEKSKDLSSYSIEDQAELLKETVDSVYVLMGAVMCMGLPFDTAFSIIHFSNMMKVKDGAEIDKETGKIKKPEDWQPVDLLPMLMDNYSAAKAHKVEEEKRAKAIVLMQKPAANESDKPS